MQRQRLAEHGPPRKYWTQVPNMIDDSDLDPYARTLYLHYLRISGQRDICEETVRDTAVRCQMSPASVTRARTQLVDRGWVSVEDMGGRGRGALLRVHLLDRWGENMARYGGTPAPEPGIVSVGNNSVEEAPECSPGEHCVSVGTDSAVIVSVGNIASHHRNNSISSPFLPEKNRKKETEEREEARARADSIETTETCFCHDWTNAPKVEDHGHRRGCPRLALEQSNGARASPVAV